MELSFELSFELAQLAARHIAEEGLSYGQAKRKAAKQCAVGEHSAAMPSNEVIEQALREYLCEAQADTQPTQLLALRHLALTWLERLPSLPYLNEPCLVLAVGAVVNGTANEHSPVHLQVFIDDDKHLEMALLDAGFALEFTQQTIHGQLRAVMVAQDQGVPVVLSLLPRVHYKLPQYHVDQPMQAATLQQLRNLIESA